MAGARPIDPEDNRCRDVESPCQRALSRECADVPHRVMRVILVFDPQSYDGEGLRKVGARVWRRRSNGSARRVSIAFACR